MCFHKRISLISITSFDSTLIKWKDLSFEVKIANNALLEINVLYCIPLQKKKIKIDHYQPLLHSSLKSNKMSKNRNENIF